MAQAVATTGKKASGRRTTGGKPSKTAPRKAPAGRSKAKKSAPAKKKQPPKNDAPQPSALRDEVVGIGILAASLCLMLALASFNLDDVSAHGQAATTGQARNLIGPVGAFVADILLYIFGAAAFLLPVTLAVPGLCLLTRRRIRLRVVDAVGYPILIFFGAMAAHLWMDGGAVLGHAAGGFIGSHGAEILKALFGQTGAYILVYAVMALTFIVTTRISLVQLAGQAARPLTERAREAASKREADKQDTQTRKAEARRQAQEKKADEKAEAKRVAAERKAEAKKAAAERKAEAKQAAAARKAEAKQPAPEVADADIDTDIGAGADTGAGADADAGANADAGESERPAGAPSFASRLADRWKAARQKRADEKARLAAIRASLDANKAAHSTDDEGADAPEDAAEWRMRRPRQTGGFVLGDVADRETRGFSLDGDAPKPARKARQKANKKRPTPAARPAAEATAAYAAPTALQPVLDADAVGVELADPLDRVAFTDEHDTVFAPAITTDPNPTAPVPVLDAAPVEPVREAPARTAAERKPARKAAPARSAPMEAEAPVSTRLPVVHDGPKRADVQLDMELAPQTADYVFPPLKFLNFDAPEDDGVDTEYLQSQASALVEALRTFKIDGEVTEIHPGPVVTMYEFAPAPGVRISRIANLADDLAMALKAIKVRIVAPIPGKGVVGFEVPNAERQMVFLQEIIGSKTFRDKKLALPMALGKDIHGNASVTDLAKMPHLLVAGTTGSGKSVGVNCMITSLLYNASPDDVRFIMVDPKMLELSIYEGVPHLLLPVVTDPMKASLALKWAVDEMERRYELMKNAGVRNIRGFNRKVLAEAGSAKLYGQLGEEPKKLPYIVVVIDEFADLMMVAGKEVEYCVARIAQKARAAGIHLILATQRPSTDVITGVIKANFPTRIAFRVSSGIDSRTILSTQGAENLLGKGDMLFLPPGTSRLDRVHGAFVSEEEISQVVDFIKAQREPDYLDESVLTAMDDNAKDDDGGDEDPMYEEAVRVVLRDGRASTSHVQRRLSLGYNRAARIIDQMERDGLVGPSRGSKPREINKQVMAELVARWDEY